MTNTDTDVDDLRTDVEPAEADESAVTLDHVLIENEDAPNECAIFPLGATEEELLTNWIAAHDDAFTDLESMR